MLSFNYHRCSLALLAIWLCYVGRHVQAACEEGAGGLPSLTRESTAPSQGKGAPLTPISRPSAAEESLRVHANGSETPVELRRSSLPDGISDGGAALKSYNLRYTQF